MEKRIVKKYKLKESVKAVLCLGALGVIILTTLYLQTVRIDKIENNKEESVNVQLTR